MNDDSIKKKMQSLREQAEKRANEGDIKRVKLELGNNYIRIVPPIKGKTKDLFIEEVLHFNVLIGAETKTVKCTKPVDGWCPICQVVSELYAAGDKEQAGNLRQQVSYPFNVMVGVVENNKIVPKQVGVLSMHPNCYLELSKKIENAAMETEGEEPPDVWDPKNGCWIKIEFGKKEDPKKPKKFWQNTYNIAFLRKCKCPLTSPEMEQLILDGVYDLNKLLPTYTAEQLKAMYLGEEPVVEESIEVEEPKPTILEKKKLSVKPIEPAESNEPIINQEISNEAEEFLKTLGV